MRLLERRWMDWRRAVAAIGIVLATSEARADDDGAALRALLAEPVQTTASKTAETGTNAPATVTLLTADDIRRYGLRTVDEAIAFLSVGGFSSENLHNPEVGARGILITGDNGAHMLLLIDGHAVNEPLYGAANLGRGLGIPIEMIDHIELVLGPGSVLYGSNAMLGTINIVTKSARTFSGVRAIAESEIGKSYRGVAAFGHETRLSGAPFEIVGGVEYFAQNGPTFHFGPQPLATDPYTNLPARFSREGEATGIWGGPADDTHYAYVPSGYVRMTWGHFTLGLQALQFKRTAPYSSRHVNSYGDFDDPENYQIDRALRGDLTYRTQLTANFGFSARAYVDSTDRRIYKDISARAGCRFPSAFTCRYANEGLSKWGGAELQGTLDWWNDGRSVTLLGFDGRQRIAQARGDVIDYDTEQPLRASTMVLNERSPILAGYLQHTSQFTKWLSLNAGGRLDYDPRFASVLSPRAAAVANVWQGGALKLAYAEAFRGPTFFESYGAVSGDPTNAILPPGALQPERVRSVEASLEQKFGANRIFFGVYRSWWTNMVERYYLSGAEKGALIASGELGLENSFASVSQHRNIASIDNFGFNGAWEGTLAGRFRYGANVTGAMTQRVDSFTGQEHAITVAPNFYGNARVAYDLEKGWPTLALAAQFSGRRIADRAFDSAFSPFPVAPPQLQLRATASGGVPFVKGLSYRMSANYAFAEHGPYVVGVGQESILFVRTAELIPVDQFRVTLGLEYELFE